MYNSYQEIIRCDDDSINWEILYWSDLSEFWRENENVLGNYSVLSDILMHCRNVLIEEEEYDFDFPGRSGINYVIYTDNATALKDELFSRLKDLTKPMNSFTSNGNKSFSESKSFQIGSCQQLVEYLKGQAAAIKTIRGPAGYGGMITTSVNILEQTAL